MLVYGLRFTVWCDSFLSQFPDYYICVFDYCQQNHKWFTVHCSGLLA